MGDHKVLGDGGVGDAAAAAATATSPSALTSPSMPRGRMVSKALAAMDKRKRAKAHR